MAIESIFPELPPIINDLTTGGETVALSAEQGKKLQTEKADAASTAAVLADKANVNQLNNPNLLDNWYFVDPINQRGQAEYTGSGYTIDRWNIYGGGTLTVTSEGVHFVGAQKTNSGFQQPIENPTRYNRMQMTFSALIKGSGTLIVNNTGASIVNMTGTGFNSDNYTLVSGTFTWNVTYPEGYVNALLWSNGSNPADFYCKAVKLELGPVSTLAHREGDAWVLNDPPPDKALELAKCQRHCFEVNTLGVGYPYVAALTANTETTAFGIVDLPVNLRTRPAVVYSGEWRLLDAVGSVRHIVTDIRLDAYDANGCTAKPAIAVTTTGLTPGKTYFLGGNGPSKGVPKLTFNANL